jgi:hypothetical protein
MSVVRLTAAAAVLGSLTSCVTTIRPPASPLDPVRVAVIDHGYHASLVLPAAGGTSVEYAYGEWEWFALNNDAWYRIFPALFWPTRGALGRRALPVPADPAALRTVVAFQDLLVFEVGRAHAEALLRRLEARHAASAGPPVHNPLVGLTFVPDEMSYSCVVHCNTVLTDWLCELGCRVSAPACFAAFRIGSGGGPAP